MKENVRYKQLNNKGVRQTPIRNKGAIKLKHLKQSVLPCEIKLFKREIPRVKGWGSYRKLWDSPIYAYGYSKNNIKQQIPNQRNY